MLRGARQVGKTHSIREFGRDHFANLVEVNLETNPEFLGCFSSPDAKTICAQLEAVANLQPLSFKEFLGASGEFKLVQMVTAATVETPCAGSVQNRLAIGFVADFSKYGRRYDHHKLQQLMNAVPRLVGKKFKYSHVDPETTARDFKLPLLDLERAGLVPLIRASGANGIPLGAEDREGVFKAQYLDIGLMMSALGLDLFSQDI